MEKRINTRKEIDKVQKQMRELRGFINGLKVNENKNERLNLAYQQMDELNNKLIKLKMED